MNGQEIIDLFYTIVDDEELGSDVLLTLLANAQELLEDERDWVILRKKDTSITHLSSDNYATAHSLPTRFKRKRKIFAQYPGGSVKELYPINYDEIEQFKDSSGLYAIDYAENKIYLTGSYSESVTLIVNYIQSAPVVELDTSVVWPGKRGAVLSYKMAEIYSGGMDGDDLNFRMSEKQEREYKLIKSGLVQWDAKLQLDSMDGRVGIDPRAK